MSPLPAPAIRIYHAPWVVPITSPVLQDGAVVVSNNQIIAVGSYSDILCRFPKLPVIKCAGVLFPALVNAHIHLELSVYGAVHPPSKSGNMCDWIKAFLQIREKSQFSFEEIRAAAKQMAQKQYYSGVGLMLDVGNIELGEFHSCPAEILSLYEVLGPSKPATQTAIAAIKKLSSKMPVTGHAPYSTSPELLQYIKRRCRKHGHLFSLHLAENLDEGFLLTKDEGCFTQFLKELGSSDSPFPIPGIDSSAVVGYLLQLGIIDSKTLCVHCIHLNDEEITILADAGAHVCLCPVSNKFLSVGTVRLQALLEHDILPAIGTDSIASNPDPDMWKEMALLKKEHPDIAAERILCMATYGGALAMGRQEKYGSLEKGKTARFLNIQGNEYTKSVNAEQLLDCIIKSGRPQSVNWL